MPISKPSTWENGFKNSPQAETTQLREMGLYLNTQGKFDALDNSWNNILNNSPITYRASALREPAGIYLTEKGIGLGINPMAPEVDFLGTFGILVREEINVYDPELTSATLTLGNFNNSDSGARGELTYYWDPTGSTPLLPALWMFAYNYGTSAYEQVSISGKPLSLNAFIVGADGPTYIEMFGGPLTAAGNVGIGTNGSFGSSANFNLALYNGAAPGSEVDGVSLYALGDGFFVRGGTNKVTTLGDTNGNVGVDIIAFGTNAENNLAIKNGTAPASDIDGVSIYAEGDAAKVRGGSGTITTFGAADPHCQRCGRDFAMEWENEEYGKLAICAWCLSEKFEDIVIEKYEGGN